MPGSLGPQESSRAAEEWKEGRKEDCPGVQRRETKEKGGTECIGCDQKVRLSEEIDCEISSLTFSRAMRSATRWSSGHLSPLESSDVGRGSKASLVDFEGPSLADNRYKEQKTEGGSFPPPSGGSPY